MTKEKRADEILKAAKAWQRGMPRACLGEFSLGGIRRTQYVYDLVDSETLEPFYPASSYAASAALSEVAGMGFDIVDAVTGE